MVERRSTQLRRLLAEGKTLVKPGAFDAMSAKIVEMAGFKIVGVSGYAVAATLLGKPDVGLTTMSEVVMVCKYIADAVSIPVIADADTGYGNAINAMRATEEFIKAGVASMHIEDQEFPKRCGHVAGKRLISRAEMVGKIRAVCRVRDELDKDFVVIARCDARGAVGGGLQELIDRCKAYVDAGADMIFPEGLLSLDELQRVVDEVGAPIHYNRTGTTKGAGLSPFIPLETLERLGKIAIVSNAVGAMQAAGHALWEYMTSFYREDTAFLERFAKVLENSPLGDFHEFVGFPRYMALEKEFLPPEELEKYDASIGYKPPR